MSYNNYCIHDYLALHPLSLQFGPFYQRNSHKRFNRTDANEASICKPAVLVPKSCTETSFDNMERSGTCGCPTNESGCRPNKGCLCCKIIPDCDERGVERISLYKESRTAAKCDWMRHCTRPPTPIYFFPKTTKRIRPIDPGSNIPFIEYHSNDNPYGLDGKAISLENLSVTFDRRRERRGKDMDDIGAGTQSISKVQKAAKPADELRGLISDRLEKTGCNKKGSKHNLHREFLDYKRYTIEVKNCELNKSVVSSFLVLNDLRRAVGSIKAKLKTMDPTMNAHKDVFLKMKVNKYKMVYEDAQNRILGFERVLLDSYEIMKELDLERQRLNNKMRKLEIKVQRSMNNAIPSRVYNTKDFRDNALGELCIPSPSDVRNAMRMKPDDRRSISFEIPTVNHDPKKLLKSIISIDVEDGKLLPKIKKINDQSKQLHQTSKQPETRRKKLQERMVGRLQQVFNKELQASCTYSSISSDSDTIKLCSPRVESPASYSRCKINTNIITSVSAAAKHISVENPHKPTQTINSSIEKLKTMIKEGNHILSRVENVFMVDEMKTGQSYDDVAINTNDTIDTEFSKKSSNFEPLPNGTDTPISTLQGDALIQFANETATESNCFLKENVCNVTIKVVEDDDCDVVSDESADIVIQNKDVTTSMQTLSYLSTPNSNSFDVRSFQTSTDIPS